MLLHRYIQYNSNYMLYEKIKTVETLWTRKMHEDYTNEVFMNNK